MTILFVWNYHYFPCEKGKSRFSDLLTCFCSHGHQVEVVCSSFYHMGKSFRDISDPYYSTLPYATTFINEPGYRKNISLKRVKSIKAFNKGVARYLESHEPVDVIYTPIPSNELGTIAETFAKRVGAKCVIDLEDLWPESFRMVIPFTPLYRLLFGKSIKRREKVFSEADGAVAVSQTYMDLILRSAKPKMPYVIAPIGADVNYVDSLRLAHTKDEHKNGFSIAYIGTLSKSYDLYTIIDALDSLYDANYRNISLKIMADGPDKDKVIRYAQKKRGKVDFLGLLRYEEMCKALFDCDIALNPIIGASVASLINKVADYAAVGLPVINSQCSNEYQNLLNQYRCGLNIAPRDTIAMQKAIVYAMKHPEWLKTAREGALRLAKEVLNRKNSEQRILSLLSTLAEEDE